MSFDIEKWKTDFVKGLDLSEDEKKVFESALSKEKNVTEIQRGYNTVSEGSRLAMEAQATKTEAERIAAEAARKDKEADDYYKSLKQYETANAARADELERYKQVLVAHNIDPNSVTGQQLIKENVAPPVPQFDQGALDEKFKDYASMETLRQAALVMTDLSFDVIAAQNRYVELYGSTEGFDIAKFKETAKGKLLTEGVPIMDTAASMYKFQEKAQEKQEQAISERVKREAEEMFAQRMSTLQLPNNVQFQQPNQTGVQLFSEEFAKPKESEAARDDAAKQHFLATLATGTLPPMSHEQ